MDLTPTVNKYMIKIYNEPFSNIKRLLNSYLDDMIIEFEPPEMNYSGELSGYTTIILQWLKDDDLLENNVIDVLRDNSANMSVIINYERSIKNVY